MAFGFGGFDFQPALLEPVANSSGVLQWAWLSSKGHFTGVSRGGQIRLESDSSSRLQVTVPLCSTLPRARALNRRTNSGINPPVSGSDRLRG